MNRLFLCFVLWSVAACLHSAQAAAPAISEVAVGGNVTVRARIQANGAATSVTLNYGPTADYGATLSKKLGAIDANEFVEFAAPAQSGGTTFFYKLVAANSDGTAESAGSRFYDATSPIQTVLPVIIGNDGKVTFAATVVPNGAETKVLFEYGAGANYGTQETKVVPAGAQATVSLDVPGLAFGLTYHYRLTASSSAGSVSSGDLTFKLEPLVLSQAPTVILKGGATLNGLVNRYGQTGEVSFQYALDADYKAATTTETTPTALDTALNEQTFAVPVTGLKANTTYHFRLKVSYADKTLTAFSADRVFVTTATAPVANADLVILKDFTPTLIDALKNDTAAAGEILTLASVTEPSKGTAVISNGKILYTPGAEFKGLDSFSYTVQTGFGVGATATVSIRGARAAVLGTHTLLLKDSDGNTVGTIRVTAMGDGSFSGKVQIGAKTYSLMGTLDEAGHFSGAAMRDGVTLAVELNTAIADGGNTLSGSVGAGKYTASTPLSALTSEERAELAGRYTIELPNAATAATTPATGTAAAPGAGWATVQLNEFGEARIKGKTSDGTAFSARASLGGTAEAPTLDLYAGRKHLSLAGTLALADKVSGTLVLNDDGASRDISVNGAPYIPPEKNRRALASTLDEGKLATITIGGDAQAGITHSLRFTKDNDVQVLDPNNDGFSMKFDEKTGTFKGKLRAEEEFTGKRDKFTGVFLQNQAAGSGFLGSGENSRPVKITFSSTAPATGEDPGSDTSINVINP